MPFRGPRSREAAQAVVAWELGGLAYYHGRFCNIAGTRGLVSRTGYTGDDGYELIVPAEAAASVWSGVLAAGAAAGALPVGLGARDTLRLEAAMPLYGHELSEKINPFQAGLGFAVQLANREFVGAAALRVLKEDPNQDRRVGLELAGERVAREHSLVLADGEACGEVTSGTFSPTLERPIAMAYVRRQFAQPGSNLEVAIRGKVERAAVVQLPFYSRA